MLRVEDLGLAIPCLAGLLKYACWAVRGGKKYIDVRVRKKISSQNANKLKRVVLRP